MTIPMSRRGSDGPRARARLGAPAPPLDELRSIYAEVDQLLGGYGCSRSTDCCHFARTGEEPYLWPVEWALLERSIAAAGLSRGRALAFGPERGCPLLGTDGGCRVYAARPFGCRTFFCQRMIGPTRRPPRAAIAELGRRIATLSDRNGGLNDGPRALSRLLRAKYGRELAP